MRSFHYHILCLISLVLTGAITSSCNKTSSVEFRIIHTTDMHGNVFPKNFINNEEGTGSLARLSSMMKEVRRENRNVLLLDGGDILQGEPTAYYYNYIDTVAPHLMASAMNYVKYDAACIGNHDIEPGHEIYDRWVKECNFPVLGANVISLKSSERKPYFPPYKTFDFNGVKVAVVGMVTPAIPEWVPQKMWTGLEFEDIIKSAKHWIPLIRKEVKPDILVALLHTGLKNTDTHYLENAGETLAKEVSGIDIMLLGHDHQKDMRWLKNSNGDSVLLMNPANHVDFASDIKIQIKKKGDKIIEKHITAGFADLNAFDPDTAFMSKFITQEAAVTQFLGKKVGELKKTVYGKDALFGASGYLSVIHNMQLESGKADISLAAPLSLSAKVEAGDIYVRDLFKFCPFSNFLYVMDMTGQEIKDYLEYSYGLWTNEMKSAQDHLLLFRPDAKKEDKYKTQNPTFNFSAAQGIDYIVDVSKPVGERVTIHKMSDGKPFESAKHYRVALNSYRGGGGGGHMTDGAKIPREALSSRVLETSSYDEMYLLMKYFESKGTIDPVNPANWLFVPKAWVSAAIKKDATFMDL
ncbi:bifunctional metallophosphatase/5'-nucleotidase [Porphyromonas pogonae]|uniref:bifunctional metallophosphatase/5'-nucleotidase n=1 Tax=Porphyromonas pogonae TaxID=867595 RepID=UPI002E77256F|nr:5'-nucleotidase C-terminal domain-containing protein [Porphyromonas pogonae]